MSHSKPLITFQTGDDYVALWCGDKQIYCHQGDIDGCVDAVVTALEGEYASTDYEEGDDFDWVEVDGITLPEFCALCLGRRAKTLDAVIAAAQKALDDLQGQRARLTQPTGDQDDE